MITPYHQATDFKRPYSLDDKITIFEAQTLGWMLDIANASINHALDFMGNSIGGPIHNSGYAVLQIALVYFELIAKTIAGFDQEGKSTYYFRKGVLEVYPHLRPDGDVAEAVTSILYRSGRCGMYHAGMTNGRIVLSGDPKDALTYDSGTMKLVINPHRLIPDLKTHFQQYIRRLRDPSEAHLRARLEKRLRFLARLDPLAK